MDNVRLKIKYKLSKILNYLLQVTPNAYRYLSMVNMHWGDYVVIAALSSASTRFDIALFRLRDARSLHLFEQNQTSP
jgi:hypothetical protein